MAFLGSSSSLVGCGFGQQPGEPGQRRDEHLQLIRCAGQGDGFLVGCFPLLLVSQGAVEVTKPAEARRSPVRAHPAAEADGAL